jgi:hypothetical protein
MIWNLADTAVQQVSYCPASDPTLFLQLRSQTGPISSDTFHRTPLHCFVVMPPNQGSIVTVTTSIRNNSSFRTLLIVDMSV